jgi:hypothetical protein
VQGNSEHDQARNDQHSDQEQGPRGQLQDKSDIKLDKRGQEVCENAQSDKVQCKSDQEPGESDQELSKCNPELVRNGQEEVKKPQSGEVQEKSDQEVSNVCWGRCSLLYKCLPYVGTLLALLSALLNTTANTMIKFLHQMDSMQVRRALPEFGAFYHAVWVWGLAFLLRDILFSKNFRSCCNVF